MKIARKALLVTFCLNVAFSSMGCSSGTVTEPLPIEPPHAQERSVGSPKTIDLESETERGNEEKQGKIEEIEKNNTIEVLTKKERRTDIKGIYVSYRALQGKKWDDIVRLLDDTDLNAVVIDVKNDHGRLTYPSAIDTAKEINADAAAKIKNLSAFLKPLKQKNTYTIARIVTFKDPYLAAKKPQWAIKRRDGSVWRDKRGVFWVDPYNEEVWNYNIRIAEEAIAAGFDEVQFDYVRFPEQVRAIDREAAFRNPNRETKDQIIQRFLRTATRRVHEAGGWTSADVFGLTTTARDGMGIGQKWELLSPEADAISPMIYPSHYAKGSYGVQHPDLKPYKIVKEAIVDAKARNEALRRNGEKAAALRPWLQDFTAKWVKPHQPYTRKQLREQIRALKELGINQYLLWNPRSKYSF